MFIPFVTQSAPQQYSNQRLVNYFPRAIPDGNGAVALIGRGGLTTVAEPGNNLRRVVEMGGALYTVSTGNVWRFDGVNAVNVGTVIASDQVSMASSGQEVAIVTGGRYYLCNGAVTTEYATGAVTDPQWVTFQDGYFLVSGTIGTRKDALTISGLDDGTTFDALEFTFAENAPDEIRGLVSDHGRVWAFGASTTQVFWNNGAADFPFTPSKSETIERGCLSGATVAKEDNSVFWVGPDKVVYRSGGGVPTVISTREVEEDLARSTIESCFVFQDRGHKFYGIRRTGDTTWCYDITTGLWAERSTGLLYAPWAVTDTAIRAGVQYFVTDSGKICTSSPDVFTDDGEAILAEAVSKPVYAPPGQDYLTINSLFISVATGAPLATTPQIVLQTSRNGLEWGVERWRSLPQTGEYEKSVHWEGLGSFKKRVQVRFRITDPVKRDLYGVQYV